MNHPPSILEVLEAENETFILFIDIDLYIVSQSIGRPLTTTLLSCWTVPLIGSPVPFLPLPLSLPPSPPSDYMAYFSITLIAPFFPSPKPPSLFPLQNPAANNREGAQCSLATANLFGVISADSSLFFWEGGWMLDPDQGKVTWRTHAQQLSVNTHGTDFSLPY